MNRLVPSRDLLRRLSQVDRQALTSQTSSSRSVFQSPQRCPLHTLRSAASPRSVKHPTSVSSQVRLSSTASHTKEAPFEPSSGPSADLDITTHYTIFPQTLPQGPPPSGPFKIDPSALRREFLQLQSRYHPDKYPPGPGKQKAEALSARVNEAYKTLKDPLLRATFILHQYHNIDVLAEDGAGVVQDPEILMEVMEVQEGIEECESHEQLLGMQVENQRRIEMCCRVIAEALERGDVEAARDETVKLRYWSSVKQAMDEWEPGKEIRLIH